MLAKSLFRQAAAFLKKPVMPYQNLLAPTSYGFSEFFRERDKAEYILYEDNRVMDKQYRKITNNWKKPLEKKRLRRERKLAEKEAQQPPQPEPEKFVVHSPSQGIELPPKDNEVFAVIQVGGSQHKVVKDDIVVTEQLKDYDINDQVVFEKVFLIGSKDYTSIGRPFIDSARVYATVEEMTLSEKVIIFKKRRRKGYKRNRGSRHPLTVLRIDKIEHEVAPDTLEKAVSLV